MVVKGEHPQKWKKGAHTMKTRDRKPDWNSGPVDPPLLCKLSTLGGRLPLKQWVRNLVAYDGNTP
jgi:hypothetical protein